MAPLPRFCLFLVVLAALAGCDEAVESTPGEARPFTLLGQLDADADTQAVRVIPIAPTIDALDPEAIDAVVMSTHLQRGESRTWRDSLVHYADGSQGHVFFAPFRAGYEETYRLDVTRSDGEAASVTVTVPPLTAVDSLTREGSFTDARYVVGVQDAPRLSGIQARYTFVGDVPTFQIVRHTDLAERVPGGWRVAIPFTADVQQLIASSETGEVGLRSFEVSVFVSNEEWNVDGAGGVFDPEVLVQPGTLSNVENGFGFFGAGYRTSRSIVPTAQDQIRAGLCLLNEEQTGCAE